MTTAKNAGTRQLLVFGEKTFKITIPKEAKVTFGPWSPPKNGQFHTEEGKRGTLRIYNGTKENILAVFAGVTGFRDLTLSYAEVVAREEGSTIWKDDERGYTREQSVKQTHGWIEGGPLLPPKTVKANGNNR